MAVNDIVPAAGEYFEDILAAASPDLLRTMIREFAQRMMGAEVEQICGATDERTGRSDRNPRRAESFVPTDQQSRLARDKTDPRERAAVADQHR